KWNTIQTPSSWFKGLTRLIPVISEMWYPNIRDSVKILSWCLFFASFFHYSAGVSSSLQECKPWQTIVAPVEKEQTNRYFYIGSVFSLHEAGNTFGSCGKISQRGLQFTDAFFWYLDKFKLLKQNLSLGGVMFDSCSDSNLVLQEVINYQKGVIECKPLDIRNTHESTLAYVGGDRVVDTNALASILNKDQRSIISPVGNTMFSNKQFPYFFQGIPNYNGIINRLVSLTHANNIRYLVVLYQNEEFWVHRKTDFIKEADRKSICSVEEIPILSNSNNYDDIIQKLQTMMKTIYVVIIADDNVTMSLLTSANINSNKLASFVFIASGISVRNEKFDKIKSVILSPTVASNFINTFANDFHKSYKNIANRKTIHPWILQYCTENNKPNCSGAFTQVKLEPAIPFLFLSLQSIISAVQNLTRPCGGYFCQSARNNIRQNIQQHILNITHYTDGGDRRVFDTERYLNFRVVKYKLQINNDNNLVDYVEKQKLNILSETSECPSSPCRQCGAEATTTNTPPVTVTNHTTPTTTRSAVPFMRVPRNDFQTGFMGATVKRSSKEYSVRDQKWIIALGVLASLGVLAVIIFEIYILYRLLGTKFGRQWRTMWLGQLLLFGVLLCYLTLFAYLPTPTDATCGITRFGVGFSYAMVFSVMLVKLMVILTSKSSQGVYANEGEGSNYLRGTYQILMFFFALGIQLVIDIQWLITIPPRAVPITDVTDGNEWICNHYTWSTEQGADKSQHFVRNEFENHVLTLIYIMFLILLTTILSMKAHGIVTNHRESVFIGLSAGLSIPIWIAWGLIGGLHRSSIYAHQYGDACIAFGLFLNATLILFAMFLPKVRQMVNMGLEGVYLEDDRETNYAESVISYRTVNRSNPGFYMNGGSSIYNGSIKDPMALHLKHPGTAPSVRSMRSARSVSSIPRSRMDSVFDPDITGNMMLKVTPDLAGRMRSEKPRPSSEHNYSASIYGRARSERGSTLSRARSTQDLGAL
ncbi:uncharacterized protein LOC115227451, partial, partial [Argonauta hians]